jgi:cobalt-zinc-cadmium efflux system outer membrane protein
MFRPRVFLLGGALLLSGCLYAVREKTDQTVCDLVRHPYDAAPKAPVERPMPPAKDEAHKAPDADKDKDKKPVPVLGTDVQTTALMTQVPAPPPTVPPTVEEIKGRLKIPRPIPGSETPLIGRPPEKETEAERLLRIRRLYPELPSLPEEPIPLPGPDGQPYTLAQLQQIAAGNSPTLRQAASDVEAARGNLIQAAAYPNPTVGYEALPSNDGSVAGVHGFFIDQLIKTGGKLRLQAAAAQKDLDNAELALRRARSDLSTAVRNAYFAVLVAKETVRVTRALAQFTDEVYRLHEFILESAAQVAPYEPAALRAQAFTARLGYEQAIAAYGAAWKQLVATVGLRQLPLTAVAGRVDYAIPFYDYDTVLAHVLNNHTDVLTARNGLDKARFTLKLAQITPVPDVDVRVDLVKEYALAPEKIVHQISVGVPFPLWDRNKGAIIAAEAALVRADEEPHRVETSLTNGLAAAYNSYVANVKALEYYRKFILPDQVRTYRGIFERRGVDPGVVFYDLVAAQQTLATGVTQYLTILGTLWTSVVSVADFLQTDDLFQLAQPRELPPLPNLDQLPLLPCCHPCATGVYPAGAPGHLPAVLPEGDDRPMPPANGQVRKAANPAPAVEPLRSASPTPAPVPVLLPRPSRSDGAAPSDVLVEPPPTVSSKPGPPPL